MPKKYKLQSVLSFLKPSNKSKEKTKPPGSPIKKTKVFKESTNEKIKTDDIDLSTSYIPSSYISSCPAGKELVSWLENPVDNNMRLPSDPAYDCTQLYIPPNEYKKLTPAQKQYWDIKSKRFDTVMLFKIGKFYEVYDYDAVICSQVLNLLYMNGKRLHSGFPESAIEGATEKLVNAGYKVGRVEQMETPDMLKKRIKEGSKNKTVKRNLCEVISKGTIMNPDKLEYKNNYLLFVLSSSLLFEKEDKLSTYFILLDLSNAIIKYTEFIHEKRNLNKLNDVVKNILVHEEPAEICYSMRFTEKLVIKSLLDVVKETFYSPVITKLPNTLTTTTNQNLTQLIENNNSEYIWTSGTAWNSIMNFILNYLNYMIIDPCYTSLLSIKEYKSSEARLNERKFMFMNPSTIESLDLINSKGGGSLFSFLDQCLTNSGKRKLKKWILNPLCNVEEIKNRQNSLRIINKHNSQFNKVRTYLKQLLDVERKLIRFYYKCSSQIEKNAVFYTANRSTSLVNLFISLIHSYKTIINTFLYIDEMKELPKEAEYEKSIFGLFKKFFTDKMPILLNFITDLENKFNFDSIAKNNEFKPTKGSFPELDIIEDDIRGCFSSFDEYIKEIRTELDDPSIYFYPTDSKNVSNSYSLSTQNNNARHEIYQLEIINRTTLEALPHDYELVSVNKNKKRFHTSFLKENVRNLNGLIDKKTNLLSEITQKLFKEICSNFSLWKEASSLISELDVLFSFNIVSQTSSLEMTLPNVLSRVDIADRSMDNKSIHLEDNWNPLLLENNLITNNVEMKNGEFVILTGPNMGGKSTLLRQVCLSIIMGQIGMYVPGSNAKMRVCDKMFTRIGANDLLIAGKSTFRIELEETLNIINNATESSFVILDELGRGTSTKDGLAIAVAVSKYIIENIKCCTIFATHYHRLLEEIGRVDVCGKHMKFELKDGKVIFQYKITDGICYQSFALNVARMAGLPVCFFEECKSKQ